MKWIIFVAVAVVGSGIGIYSNNITAPNKHVIGPAIITDIGDCGSNSAIFGSVYTCTIAVQWNGSDTYVYGHTHDRVMVGQAMYKECWMENGGSRCYDTFTSNPRESFTK